MSTIANFETIKLFTVIANTASWANKNIKPHSLYSEAVNASSEGLKSFTKLAGFKDKHSKATALLSSVAARFVICLVSELKITDAAATLIEAWTDTATITINRKELFVAFCDIDPLDNSDRAEKEEQLRCVFSVMQDMRLNINDVFNEIFTVLFKYVVTHNTLARFTARISLENLAELTLSDDAIEVLTEYARINTGTYSPEKLIEAIIQLEQPIFSTQLERRETPMIKLASKQYSVDTSGPITVTLPKQDIGSIAWRKLVLKMMCANVSNEVIAYILSDDVADKLPIGEIETIVNLSISNAHGRPFYLNDNIRAMIDQRLTTTKE